MRVSKDWTFSWEALKYKVLGTHRSVIFAVFVILPQFCLILLGYLLTKRPSFAKKDFWNVTEKLVFYVLFPPLIFLSVAKATYRSGSAATFLLISISSYEYCGYYGLAGEFLN